MNRSLFSIGLVCTLFFTISCVGQSSETRSFGSFDGIKVSEGIKVTVKKGSSNEAKITASGIDIDDVISKVEHGSLKFELEGNNHGRNNVEVELSFSGSLEELAASSAGRLTILDGVNFDNDLEIDASSSGKVTIETSIKIDELDVDASSAGKITIEEVKAENVDAQCSSSGKIELSGTADEVKVQASSGGKAYFANLKSNDVKAGVSSGGGAEVHVNGRLDVNASSGGWVKYKGSPSNKNINKSSGGSVRSL